MTDDELMEKVWQKAKSIRGEDSKQVRKDPYGNQIRKDQYGKGGLQGWEVDHIKPVNRGWSDNLRNLQAMQTRKNRKLGDTLKKRSRHNQK